MIAFLNGKLISKETDEIIIDVGGVGYQVHTTLSTTQELPSLDEEVTLYIYTHVREDSLALYGFKTHDEKVLFTKLLKVNGIGPRLALSILSGVPPHDFVQAVASEDLARLNAIPGVGKKTAERIIIDLKDKLQSANFLQMPTAGKTKNAALYDDALSALVNLGYNRVQAERTLGKIGLQEKTSVTHIIKDALKELAR